MDKNTVIGLLLIFALFMGFSFYQTSRNQKLREEQQELVDKAIEKAEEEKALSLDNTPQPEDSTQLETLSSVQQFSNPQLVDTSDYVVETDKAYYYFSKKGGYLTHLFIKDVYRYTPKDSAKMMLELFEGGSNEMNIRLLLRDQTEIATRDCYFLSTGADSMVVDEKHKTLSLRLYPNAQGDSIQCQTLDPDSYIEYLYTFDNDDYRYVFKVRFVNMEKYLYANKHDYTLEWNAQPRSVEKNYETEQMITTVYYMDNTNAVEHLEERSDDKKAFTSALKWVSFKQQFFTACLIAEDQSFSSANLEVSAPDAGESSVLKNCMAELDFEMLDLF